MLTKRMLWAIGGVAAAGIYLRWAVVPVMIAYRVGRLAEREAVWLRDASKAKGRSTPGQQGTAGNASG
jgi:hypothetical protein